MKDVLRQPLSRDTWSFRVSGILRELLTFGHWGESVSSVLRMLKSLMSPYFTPWSFLKYIQALSALGLDLLAGKGQGLSAEKSCGDDSGALLSGNNYCFHSSFKGEDTLYFIYLFWLHWVVVRSNAH